MKVGQDLGNHRGSTIAAMICKRPPQRGQYSTSISDLLDAAQARSQLAGLRDATHVVYCAFQSSGTQAADFARGTEANGVASK